MAGKKREGFNSPRVLLQRSCLSNLYEVPDEFQFSKSLIATWERGAPAAHEDISFNSPRVLLQQTAEGRRYESPRRFQFSKSLIATQNDEPVQWIIITVSILQESYCNCPHEQRSISNHLCFNSPRVLLQRVLLARGCGHGRFQFSKSLIATNMTGMGETLKERRFNSPRVLLQPELKRRG